jgi:site-specific DNA-methyltransferase (adenine-specific)
MECGLSLYYEDDFVKLYHGDCLTEHREWLEADVLVTDPPYGMAYTGFGGRKGEPRRATGPLSVAGDGSIEVRDAALDAWGEGPAIVFGKWTVDRPANVKMRLIWDKTPCGFMGDLSMPWGGADEEVYILGSGFIGKRQANILRYPTLMSGDKNRPDHPTPKPLGLMEHLIERCPSGVIADPFSGSGSTLVAAKAVGRKAIGVELEERYCEVAAKRLAQDVLDIFAA